MCINPFNFFVKTRELKQKIIERQSLAETDFTILSFSLEMREESGLSLLNECMEAFPKEPVRNLVCLSPERLITHEVLAQLQATVKLDQTAMDDEETLRAAFELVNGSLSSSGEIQNLQDICEKLYLTLFAALNDFFNLLREEKTYPGTCFSNSEQVAMKQMYEHLAAIAPWSTDPLILKRVCLQRALAFIYSRQAKAQMGKMVHEIIEKLCMEGKLEKLGYMEKKEGVAIFTTGGVASGKGSCLQNIEASLKTRTPGIRWNELVHHNADRIKPFLLAPEKKRKRYSQYTYEEALLVKERTMEIIAEWGKIHERYPHFLHDQTKLKIEELLEAKERYSEIIVTAVSTDVNTAIERAYERGLRTSRFEHTEGLLASHQAVPGEFIKVLSNDLLMDSNIQIAMYDNNSSDLKMFASIDMRKKIIHIYNEEDMQNWIKKETINPKANNEESLYTGDRVHSMEEYFAALLTKGFILNLDECEQSLTSSISETSRTI